VTLGLEPTVDAGPREGRLVEVAIDAAGAAGARPYTYRVPPALAGLADGEAVLVEFGRRQALGVVLGPAATAPEAATRDILDRVRADGPLLPPLTLALARWVAAHYLAPPALVIRSFLPPGLLERLELVAEATPAPGDAAPDLDPVDKDLLDQLRDGARAVRDLAAPDGRAGLLRRLRALAGSGAVTLDWTLLGAGAGPRYERRVHLTEEGRVAVAALAGGGRLPGRPLGSRQVALLEEVGAGPHTAEGWPAAELA
jgi:primosomal protein N'